MAQRINNKFTSANFVVSQLKDREQRLKKDYNSVKTILSKSGFGWDNELNMATTINEVWTDLPDKLQKWKGRSFPYYDDLHEIYNGKIAKGKHCRRSSEKLFKSEYKSNEDDDTQMSPTSPTSPTMSNMQGPFLDLINDGGYDLSTENAFSYDINTSQYRAMAENVVSHDMNSTLEVDDVTDLQESQQRKSPHTIGAKIDIPVRQERDKKKNRKSDNAMNELTALRKEELEAYKKLTEKQLQLKRTQIQQNDPTNDPYSMQKCMTKLKSLPLQQTELLKAINFLKGDREATEIFMCCDEDSLAEAYIKGSI